MITDQMMLNQIPQKTPVENLFLVGGWNMPAGGVSAVMNGAVNCADLVEQFLVEKIKTI